MRKNYFSPFVFLFITFCLNIQAATTIQTKLAGKIDLVVAADNSGDFKKVQDAINSIPDNNAVRKVIFIKKGKYTEKLVVPYKKTNITLVGENVDSTIISNSDASLETIALNTFTSYTMRIDADDFEAMNLTIENTATSAQAVALHTNGDRQTFLHCRILGYQDAYFSNIRRRNYVKDCFCQGAVDYLFGFGIVLFDSCQINTTKSGGYMTAAATSENYRFGYVLRNCKIASPSSVTSFYLGRPWFAHSNTVLFKCNESSSVIPAGWMAWAKREDTCYYREYKCTGSGSATSGRASFGKQLTDQESQKYALDTIFAKSAFPQGPTADTFETNTILRRFLVSTTPNMEQIAQTFLKCGRDTFPVIPTADWQPRVDTNSIYAVIKANTVKFLDTGKVVAVVGGNSRAVHANTFSPEVRVINRTVFLSTSKALNAPISISVFDVQGTLVYSKIFSEGLNRTNSCKLPAGLHRGIYSYSLRVNREVLAGVFAMMQ